MKKSIAVIGANGYIARNLIYTLKRDYSDYKLFLYDRQETQTDGEENYHSIDIFSKESVKKIDLTCDIIFMLVGKTGSANGFTDYDSFIDVNERSLLNILNEYRNQSGKGKIIFPSTRLVYRGAFGELGEDAEKEFKTIYAINKFACEQYLQMFHRVYDISYCIFRICIPYGTLVENSSSYGTAEFMLGKATNGENITLYGDGSVRRTLIYMGDLCRLLIEGAISDQCCNDIFNIGGENYSLAEMAKLIADKYNVKVEYVEWPEVAEKIESGDTVFLSKKYEKAVNQYPTTTFEKWIRG